MAQHAEKFLDKLFVYGSLNNSHHIQLLTGRSLPIEEAVLYGYRRFQPKSGYPFVLATHRDLIRSLGKNGYTVYTEQAAEGNRPDLVRQWLNRGLSLK